MKLPKLDPEKVKKWNRQMKVTAFFCLVIVIGAGYFLISKKWSSYVFLLSDKHERLVFIGEYSSQNKCSEKSQQKLREGIRLSQHETANSYLCGKYCFENPLSSLSKTSLYCMFRVQSH